MNTQITVQFKNKTTFTSEGENAAYRQEGDWFILTVSNADNTNSLEYARILASEILLIYSDFKQEEQEDEESNDTDELGFFAKLWRSFREAFRS